MNRDLVKVVQCAGVLFFCWVGCLFAGDGVRVDHERQYELLEKLIANRKSPEFNREYADMVAYKKGGGSRSIPGEVGARGSKLYKILKEGHYGVKLTDEQWQRITTWLDTNCVFYGAYRDEELQLKGKVVMPLLE